MKGLRREVEREVGARRAGALSELERVAEQDLAPAHLDVRPGEAAEVGEERRDLGVVVGPVLKRHVGEPTVVGVRVHRVARRVRLARLAQARAVGVGREQGKRLGRAAVVGQGQGGDQGEVTAGAVARERVVSTPGGGGPAAGL